MNPSYISLVFLIVMIPLVIIGQLMPTLNLHIASDREALMRQQAELELTKSLRLSKPLNQVQDDLMKLKLTGLNIKSVLVSTDGEYVLAELAYQYSGLLVTKFFTQQNQIKTIKVATVMMD